MSAIEQARVLKKKVKQLEEQLRYSPDLHTGIDAGNDLEEAKTRLRRFLSDHNLTRHSEFR